VLSVLRHTTFIWPLCCLYFDILLLFGHCVVCTSTYYFYLAIVLSVLQHTTFIWPLCCLYFDILLLITPFVSSNSSSTRWIIIGPWEPLIHIIALMYRVKVMGFKSTFNNILVLFWQSVLLVEVTGVPKEKHRPATNHWQTLWHFVVSSTPFHKQELDLQLEWW